MDQFYESDEYLNAKAQYEVEELEVEEFTGEEVMLSDNSWLS